MSSSRTKTKTPHGFTLLEVLLAVAVLALVSVSLYRFVETTLKAVRISTERTRENTLTTAFAAFLGAQLQSLPPARGGRLIGEAHRFNDVSSDELRWISGPGSGLLTRFADGEWNVTLTARQLDGGKYELGLRRQEVGGRQAGAWLPLFGDVNGFELRYYDTRVHQWMEKWTDPTVLPSLVRMRLWRNGSTEAYEKVFPLPVSAEVSRITQKGPGVRVPGGPPAPPGQPGASATTPPGQPGGRRLLRRRAAQAPGGPLQ